MGGSWQVIHTTDQSLYQAEPIFSFAYAGGHGLGRGGMRNDGWELRQVFDLIASGDFAHRRMTHRSLGAAGYGFLGGHGLDCGAP